MENRTVGRGKSTFQFIKVARLVRTNFSTAIRVFIFWRKERTKESSTDLPSAFRDEDIWFSIMRFKANEENPETTAFRTWASASYAASWISASAYLEHLSQLVSGSILLKLTNSNSNWHVQNDIQVLRLHAKHTSESEVGDETIFQKKFHKKLKAKFSKPSLSDCTHHSETTATAFTDIICSSKWTEHKKD